MHQDYKNKITRSCHCKKKKGGGVWYHLPTHLLYAKACYKRGNKKKTHTQTKKQQQQERNKTIKKKTCININFLFNSFYKLVQLKKKFRVVLWT